MYILGDVIDRGPDGISLLEYIRRQPNMKMIMGNHEDMMLKSTRYPAEEMWIGTWMFNGGGTTLNSLRSLSREDRLACLDYVRNLPLYRVVSVGGIDYLLIHAGLSVKEGTMEENCRDIDEEEALWIRAEFLILRWFRRIILFLVILRPGQCFGMRILFRRIRGKDAADFRWLSGTTESELTVERLMERIWAACD